MALAIGLMAIFEGSQVLLGIKVPSYHVLWGLVYYNVALGIVSVLVGIGLWRGERLAVLFAGVVAGAHVSVLIILSTIFSDLVAQHSIKAMIFRSVVWVLLFFILRKKGKA